MIRDYIRHPRNGRDYRVETRAEYDRSGAVLSVGGCLEGPWEYEAASDSSDLHVTRRVTWDEIESAAARHPDAGCCDRNTTADGTEVLLREMIDTVRGPRTIDDIVA